MTTHWSVHNACSNLGKFISFNQFNQIDIGKVRPVKFASCGLVESCASVFESRYVGVFIYINVFYTNYSSEPIGESVNTWPPGFKSHAKASLSKWSSCELNLGHWIKRRSTRRTELLVTYIYMFLSIWELVFLQTIHYNIFRISMQYFEKKCSWSTILHFVFQS